MSPEFYYDVSAGEAPCCWNVFVRISGPGEVPSYRLHFERGHQQATFNEDIKQTYKPATSLFKVLLECLRGEQRRL